MTGPLVCGVDSSTQSTKVEIRSIDDGRIVAVGRAPHPAVSPPRSEQDPEAWWQALQLALGEAAAGVDGGLAGVAALSIGGQQHGMVVVGTEGEVLRPAKLWNDTESAPNADALVDRLGSAEWARRTGSVPVAAFTITKLAWLAEHEPEAFAATARVMLPHDWLTWRATGRHVTDRGDASGSGWWSPATGTVDTKLLDLLEPGRDWSSMVPTVLGPVEQAGALTAEAAEALGLPAGCVVGPGTGDNMAAALGLGLEPGDVVVSLGTSGTAYAVSEVPTADPSGAVAGFADATGRYLPLVCTLNATRVTDTVASLLGAERDGFAEMALAAPPGSRGVTLVPFFDGERTPNLPLAAGMLDGLRNDTMPADLARAAHEGVVCGLLQGVDALVSAGVDVAGRFFLVGGGARSAAFPTIAAGLAGRTVRVPNDDEVVATGACVQAAAVVTGKTPTAIARRWGLGAGRDIDPDPAAVEASSPVRARYADAVGRVRRIATAD